MTEPKTFLRLTACAVTVVLFSMAMAPAWAESPAVRIYASFSERVAYIETVGTLYDDSIERNYGSGFLVGDKLVITNSHLIPSEDNFRELKVYVRLGSRQAAPIQVASFVRDVNFDLAALTLAAPTTTPQSPSCPIRIMDQGLSVPIGSSVYVIGYPVDQDISISTGIVSNKTGPRGRWQTTTPLNPGNSGGPVFGETGMLVGFAVGGVVRWQHGGDVIAVQGVNFLIPTPSLINGPLAQQIRDLPQSTRCWELASAWTAVTDAFSTVSTFASTRLICKSAAGGGVTCSSAPEAPKGPLEFSRSYTVTQVKDNHPGLAPDHESFEEKFAAEPGYKIAKCDWNSSSANQATGIACNVDQDGASATFRYRLSSGPAFDRYRGWLYATVTVRQQRQ